MLKYLKIILEPIKYSKISFSIFNLMGAFDTFQRVFIVVLLSFIIEALESGDIEKLYFWTGIFIILSVINLLSSFFSDPLFTSMFNDIKFGLEGKYLTKYVKLDNTSIESYGTGKMNNIIFKGIDANFNILRLSVGIFVEFFAIVYIFILVLTKVPNYYYFVSFICLFILIIFLFGKGISKIVEIRKKAKKLDIEMDNRKVKILMSKFEIFQNEKIDYEISMIGKLHKEYKKIWWIGNIKKNLWQFGAEAILKGFYIVLFLIIGVGVINSKYDIATFALLIWILQILSRYAWQIRGYMRDIASNFIDLEKLIDVFETIPMYKDDSKLPDFEYNKGDIEFKNINFNYEKSNNVLENFNLTLEGGKKYALVGESGGGKSTLVKLISGYIKPVGGNIIIDNQNIAETNLKSFYKHIGYLSQEPSIFDGSIIENLLYALDYIPEESKLDEIIKQSKCEFIYDLENKLETQIGEKGVRLSGGQKQRLAIAKIMLKNPKIIILDEPTSALDSFNEEQISIALRNLFENKTVIVVAHRLQTVKHSDKIFYIEDGKIIESGNHKELLDLKGNYFKMIDLQSGF